MRLFKKTQTALVTAAMLGMLLPASLLSADELPQPQSTGAPTNTDAPAKAATTPPSTIDVSLDDKDVLKGHLVDSAGNPAADVNVFLLNDGRIVAAGCSNEKGAFAIANLAGGKYQIAAGDRAVDVRCWAGDTAPPNAVASTLIQVNDVQRAQVHPGTCLLANPWIAGGIIAAAILVPVAIKNVRDNRDDNSGAGNSAS